MILFLFLCYVFYFTWRNGGNASTDIYWAPSLIFILHLMLEVTQKEKNV